MLALGWFSGRASGPALIHSPASPQVQTGGVYNLTWNTIAGDGFIQGDVYTLTGGFYTSIPVNSIHCRS